VLRARLQVRREGFGALLYDRTDRKLLFLRSPTAARLLQALPAARPAAVAAAVAAGAGSPAQVESEFDELLALGMIVREEGGDVGL